MKIIKEMLLCYFILTEVWSKKDDQIAQLICECIFFFNLEIEKVQVLDDTESGSGSFGSTGKN